MTRLDTFQNHDQLFNRINSLDKSWSKAELSASESKEKKLHGRIFIPVEKRTRQQITIGKIAFAAFLTLITCFTAPLFSQSVRDLFTGREVWIFALDKAESSTYQAHLNNKQKDSVNSNGGRTTTSTVNMTHHVGHEVLPIQTPAPSAHAIRNEVLPVHVSVSTPFTETVTPPEEPKLPKLFSLNLSEDHPLSQPLRKQITDHVDPTLITSLSLDKEGFNDKDLEDFVNQVAQKTPLNFYGKFSFQRLMDVPLSYFGPPNPLKSVCVATVEAWRASDWISLIEERVQQLDNEIQLFSRQKKLIFELPITATIADVLPSWSNSPLKYKLMMFDEFEELKLSEIKRDCEQFLSTRMIQKLREKTHSYGQMPVDEASFGDLSLKDCRKLTADQVNRFANKLPPVAFALLPASEMSKIDLTKLDLDQLHRLLSASENMQNLTDEQIAWSFSKVKNKQLFSNLSDKQVLNLDFSKTDPEILEVIFSTARSELIKQLKLSDIYQLSPLFSSDFWGAISKQQALDFDFSKITDEKIRQKAFNSIFSDYGDKRIEWISELSLDKIYVANPLFSMDHWGKISKKNALDFDFSKITDEKIRQKAFNSIFSDYYDKKIEWVSELSLVKIYAANPLFSKDHWGKISKENALAFDFSKITDEKIRQQAFNSIFSDYYDKRIEWVSEFSLDKVYAASSVFSPDHWCKLKAETVKACDFSKIAPHKLKEMVQTLFSDYRTSFAKEVIPGLKKEQKDLIRPHLPSSAVQYL